MHRLVTLCSMACTLAVSTSQASSILVSTFNDDKDNQFDCCNGYDVYPFQDYVRQDVAAAFTPAADAEITKIDIALTGWKDSPRHRELIVQLRDTDGYGGPGTTLRDYTLKDIPPYDNPCCTFVTKHMKPLALAGGKMYWVVVKALEGMPGDWQYNTAGIYGTIAINIDVLEQTWEVQPGYQMPAFRIWAE